MLILTFICYESFTRIARGYPEDSGDAEGPESDIWEMVEEQK